MGSYYVAKNESNNRVYYNSGNGRVILLPIPVLVDLKTNLISVWDFEETTGTVAYDAHGSNDLTIVGSTLNQTGHLNKCFSYDGTNDLCRYNVANNNLAPISNHSISLWFKRLGDAKNGNNTTTNAEGSLMMKYYSTTGNRQYFSTVANSTHGTIPNTLRWGYWDSSNVGIIITYNPGSDIFTNNWAHVVFWRSGSSIKIYLNGSEVATGSGGNGSMRQATTWKDTIGACERSSFTPDFFFNGLIDQVAVWSIALSQDQVTALYNSGNGLAYSSWN